MNVGIYPPSSQIADPPMSIGGAPARPVQTPGGIDGALDWRRHNWAAIQDSIYGSLRTNNWGYGPRVTAATISAAVAENYTGTALTRNGKVVASPFQALNVLVFDASTNRTSVLGSFSASGLFTSCVTLNDGRVFVVPRSSTTARIVDAENRVVTTPATIFPGNNAYTAGCLMDGGRRIYLAPRVRTTASIYDIQQDTLFTPAGTFSSSSGQQSISCVFPLPDGRIFCAPSWNTAAIYDPVSDSLRTSSLDLGGNKYFGAILLPSGEEILILQSSATAMLIYDWQRDRSRTVVGAMQAVGRLAPNGSVLLLPRTSSSPWNARVYWPLTGTATTLPETFSNNAPSAGLHVLPDGRMCSIPRSDTGVYTYGSPGPSFDLNVPLSPYQNHR